MPPRSPTQRPALILAGGLTAFTLVLIGAVASRATSGGQWSPEPTAVSTATEAATAAAPGSDLRALIVEREAAYRQVVQEANDRLAEANARLQRAASRPPAAARAAAPPQASHLTPDLAAQIALNLAPGASLLRPPELVSFQGTVAYEVALQSGQIYLDAVSGRVLHNGTTQPGGQGSAGRPDGGAGGEDEDRHEGEDGEEDREAHGGDDHDEEGHDG